MKRFFSSIIFRFSRNKPDLWDLVTKTREYSEFFGCIERNQVYCMMANANNCLGLLLEIAAESCHFLVADYNWISTVFLLSKILIFTNIKYTFPLNKPTPKCGTIFDTVTHCYKEAEQSLIRHNPHSFNTHRDFSFHHNSFKLFQNSNQPLLDISMTSSASYNLLPQPHIKPAIPTGGGSLL